MGLDAQQRQLIDESEISALVYGRDEDFLIIRLDIDEPGEDTIQQQITDRCLKFCGVLALSNGEAVARLASDNPSAPRAVCFAGLAFANTLAEHLRRPMGDTAEWLERLLRMS